MKKDKECMGKVIRFKQFSQFLGKRYIELMILSSQNTPIDGIGPNGEYLFMIHMRGLPFRVHARDIVSVSCTLYCHKNSLFSSSTLFRFLTFISKWGRKVPLEQVKSPFSLRKNGATHSKETKKTSVIATSNYSPLNLFRRLIPEAYNSHTILFLKLLADITDPQTFFPYFEKILNTYFSVAHSLLFLLFFFL